MTPPLPTRISWREKLEKPQEAKIVDVPPKMQKRWGAGRMVIPQPLAVDALIRQVPEGKLVTVTQLRERLAKDYQVDSACPITTGIFIRIAAEAAEENLRGGREPITPYWRVINPDGSLKEKFPGGLAQQARRLRAEGHKIEEGKGKKAPRVKDFEKYLAEL